MVCSLAAHNILREMLHFTIRHAYHRHTLNNCVIHAPASVKDLGATIDNDLKFKHAHQ